MLERAIARGAVWISAGAGTGKSTLAAVWGDSRPGKLLWFRADEGDASPAVAFEYFAALCGRKRSAASLPRFDPRKVDRVDLFARTFFRAFYATIPAAVTLVLDDAHAVPGKSFEEILAAALSEAPADVALVVLSRHDPSGLLLEAIGRGALQVIDGSALSFTLDEATELFADRLDARTVRRVHSRAGGWVAGMLLIAQQDKGSDAATAADERVAAYFAERVLGAFDSSTLRLLVAASLLESVDEAALARLGFGASGRVSLERLRRRNLFVTRLDRVPPCWRLHDLLREALRARFPLTGDHGWRQSTLVAAASICADCDRIGDAVQLYIEAGEPGAALALAEDRARALVEARRLAEIDAITAVLPRESVAGSFALQVALGQCAWQRRDSPAALACFESAYILSDQHGPSVDCLLVAAAALPAIFDGWQTYHRTAVWADRLRQHGEARERVAPGRERLRIDRAWLQTADQLWDDALCDRSQLFDRVLAQLRDPPQGVQSDEVVATSCVLLESAGFNLHDEERFQATVALTAPWLGRADLTPLAKAQWLVGYAPLGRHWPASGVKLPAAAGNPSLELAFDLAHAHGGHAVAFAAADMRIGGAIADNDLPAAQRWLQAMRDVSDPCHVVQTSTLLGSEGAVLGLAGEWKRALAALDRADAIAREHGHPETDLWNRAMVRYRIWIASGELRRAHEAILRDAPSFPEGMRRDFALILADVAEAAEFVQSKNPVPAGIVSRIMERAAKYNWRGIAQMLVPLMAHICGEALKLGIEVEFARRLIREKRLPASSPFDPHWPWPIRIHALGGLQVVVSDLPLSFGPRAPRKSLDLLKLVIAHGPAPVDAAVALDALWPDAEGATARAAFDMAVMRLRKLLGTEEAVLLDAGRIGLDPARVWVDAYAFMSGAIDDYPGPLFGNEAPQPWSAAARERLHQRYLRRTLERARALEAEGRHAEALALYEAALAQDSLAEELYQGAIRCHVAEGRASDAMRVFRRCREQLSIVLSVRPSAATQALVASLQSK
jgi:DNA-binding SARP family transcriptional activator